MIADFERYYRPLPLMLSEGRSPRYILALVQQLPFDSAFVAELRGGPQFRGWTPDRYLLAGLVDATQMVAYVVSKANGGKGKKPDPVYRPQKSKPKHGNAFASMARGFYERAKAKITKE